MERDKDQSSDQVMSADDENGCDKGSHHDQDKGVPSYPLKSPLRASRSIGEGVSQPAISNQQSAVSGQRSAQRRFP